VTTFEATVVVVVGAWVGEDEDVDVAVPPTTADVAGEVDAEETDTGVDAGVDVGVVVDVDVVAGRATGRGSRLLEHPTRSTARAAPATTHRPLTR
jgi:hypothetical protein